MVRGAIKQNLARSNQPSSDGTTLYPIHFLDWDSDFFGFKMGSVDLSGIPAYNYSESAWQETVAEAHRQGYQFLLCQIDATAQLCANRILESGARIGDILMTFRRDLAPASWSTAGDSAIGEATEQDLPALFEMAAASFGYSRFLQDSRFEPEKARQLYRNWLAQSYQKERVLVAKSASDPGAAVLGFISLGLDCGTGPAVIRLLATHPDARGMGVGNRLMARVFDLALQAGLQAVQVGTQINNYGAIRFYEKMGFRCHHLKYRLHLWLDERVISKTGW